MRLPVNADTFEHEVYFDPEGNLLMITKDQAATTGTRYKTIGWTIKKENLPIEDTLSARIMLSETGSEVKKDGTVYTHFETPASTVMNAIFAVSEDWALALSEYGGYVYLDAIMTVTVNGVPYGSMDEWGNTYGEVYFTREGIAGAASWSDPSGLFSHFGLRIEYPPTDPGGEETSDYDYSYGREYVDSNELVVYAQEYEDQRFDVSLGIPTGEELGYLGSLQKYYFDISLTKHSGEMMSSVKLIGYSQDEDGELSMTSMLYSVKKPYCYYTIKKLSVYTIESGYLKNAALPQGRSDFPGFDEITVEVEKNRGSYVEAPPVTELWIEKIDYDAMSSEAKREAAEKAAGGIKVRNDVFKIDGINILKGSWTTGEASGIHIPSEAKRCEVRGSSLLIPHTVKNGIHGSAAYAVYKKYNGTALKKHEIEGVNGVAVHTPVVCAAEMSDDKRHNQQVIPTQFISLVLGRQFELQFTDRGEHRNIKGYGMRDYGKYILRREVIFPFEVYSGETRIDAQVPVAPDGSGKLSLYLPVGVEEGDYEIKLIVYAKNHAASGEPAPPSGRQANLNIDEYSAYRLLKVHVSGRMYDLSITGIQDYPRWEDVFRENDEYNGFRYRLGRLSMERTAVQGREDARVFPVLSGSHPYDEGAGPVGLGYFVDFELKTIGSMRGDMDGILLMPVFYHMDRDGTNRHRVKLYDGKELTLLSYEMAIDSGNRYYRPVLERNVSDEEICLRSIQLWRGSFGLSPDVVVVDSGVDLEKYIEQRGGRLSRRDPVIERSGLLLVRFEIESVNDGRVNLSFANPLNERYGYCNMWKDQGFFYERVDSLGNRFTFLDGDFLVFDMDNGIYKDYESWGTH